MKNPMGRQLEKRLSERAVKIGREGEIEAFDELLTLLRSSSANTRRLASSALGFHSRRGSGPEPAPIQHALLTSSRAAHS